MMEWLVDNWWKIPVGFLSILLIIFMIAIISLAVCYGYTDYKERKQTEKERHLYEMRKRRENG